MCVSPGSVFIYRRPGDSKWTTKYYGSMPRDEALAQGLDIDVMTARSHGLDAKWSVVPCGQCHECRLQRSRTWANRCMMEMSEYPDLDGVNRNWFITLTYAPGFTDDLRSTVDFQTLSLHQRKPGEKKDHLQQFLHDLRQEWQRRYGHDGIRFYACGEYGDTSGRPHYHAILFNLPIDPTELEKRFSNEFGDPYYNHERISEIWGKGFAVLSPATWTNCAYTARYIMKKQTGDNAVKAYDDLGLLAPFTRSSRRPGIAFNSFKGYESYVDVDDVTGELRFKRSLVLPVADKHVDPTCNHPRYFDKLMSDIDPDFMDLVKQYREKMAQIAYETQKRLMPMSDRQLFGFRKDQFDKHPIGIFRKTLE